MFKFRGKKLPNIPLDDNITHIKLYSYNFIDLSNFKWPSKLQYLCTYFRPNFKHLPKGLHILEICTHNKVLKFELPQDLQKLILHPGESKECKFDIRMDDFEVYYIDRHNFSKYTKFIGGTFEEFEENCIDNDYTWYHYETSGDIYKKRMVMDLDSNSYFFCDYDYNNKIIKCEYCCSVYSNSDESDERIIRLLEQNYTLKENMTPENNK